jgi:hypothetical protein
VLDEVLYVLDVVGVDDGMLEDDITGGPHGSVDSRFLAT